MGATDTPKNAIRLPDASGQPGQTKRSLRRNYKCMVRHLNIRLLDGRFALSRLPPGSAIADPPPWPVRGGHPLRGRHFRGWPGKRGSSRGRIARRLSLLRSRPMYSICNPLAWSPRSPNCSPRPARQPVRPIRRGRRTTSWFTMSTSGYGIGHSQSSGPRRCRRQRTPATRRHAVAPLLGA